MKLICDCGEVLHDRKQVPIGPHPDDPTVTFETSIGFWFTSSPMHATGRHDIGACKCGRIFVRVDVMP